ncbi:MAG: outer membrane protein assembly factor BamD [Hyphomonadaceae bacterium]
MDRRLSLLARVAGAAAIALSLGACTSDRERAAMQFQEEPVAQLYNRAAELLDRRRWTEAAAAFQEVERQHPYSSWARRAILMQAYAHYQGNDYAEAVSAAQRFIALHPGNESAPYAYYLISICYFEQILDVGRDQATTQAALTALQEVIRRYPQSDYARDARLKLDMTYDQLAGKEMEVGRFYLNQNQTLAAMNRFRRVVEDENFQRTSHVPEALHRLVEAYLTVGMNDEAQRSAAVLGYNFPGSEWYERTYRLMADRGVTPADEGEARRRGWLSRIF